MRIRKFKYIKKKTLNIIDFVFGALHIATFLLLIVFFIFDIASITRILILGFLTLSFDNDFVVRAIKDIRR